MNWWSNGKPKEKQPALTPWACAKRISKAEAEQPLPPGWYIYQDGYVWYGMRPNADQTGLEKSSFQNQPRDLEPWLGVPVPAGQAESAQSLNDILNSVTVSNSPEATQEPEEELDTDFLEKSAESPSEPSEKEPAVEQKGVGRKRPNQVHFYLSDEELIRLRRRVRLSGAIQSAFLRQAALNSKIIVDGADPSRIAILDELTAIRAELGRQGGMLKMVIKPNEGQRTLSPKEWDELIQAVRYLEHTKQRLSRFEEKYGDHNP